MLFCFEKVMHNSSTVIYDLTSKQVKIFYQYTVNSGWVAGLHVKLLMFYAKVSSDLLGSSF